MTDQPRPPDQPAEPEEPGREPPAEPAPEQPTVAWTPPSGEPPTPPDAPPPTPETPPPPSSGWTQPPPSETPVPPGAGWTEPSAPAAAPGPLLSATPAAAGGWTQPVVGQREVAPGLVFSDTPSRFVAYLVDGLILSLISGVISSVFRSPQPFTPGAQIAWTAGDVVATILSVAIGAAYFVGFWSGGRRATLGQMLFKIQVANAFDGRPLTLEQALKRWFALGEWLNVFAVSLSAAAALSGLGAIWALVLLITTATSPTKQGLHDRFANSAVVRPANAGNGLVLACLVIVGLFLLIGLVGFVGLILLGTQVSDMLSQVGTSVQQP